MTWVRAAGEPAVKAVDEQPVPKHAKAGIESVFGKVTVSGTRVPLLLFDQLPNVVPDIGGGVAPAPPAFHEAV